MIRKISVILLLFSFTIFCMEKEPKETANENKTKISRAKARRMRKKRSEGRKKQELLNKTTEQKTQDEPRQDETEKEKESAIPVSSDVANELRKIFKNPANSAQILGAPQINPDDIIKMPRKKFVEELSDAIAEEKEWNAEKIELLLDFLSQPQVQSADTIGIVRNSQKYLGNQ